MRWKSLLSVALTERQLSTIRGGVLLLLVAAVLGAFVPSVPDWSHRFLGAHYVDGYGTQWFYWFVDRALKNGFSTGHTDLFFYPWGKDIFGHTGTNVLDAILCIPFRRAFGPVLGYNMFVFAGLLATAVAVWHLIRDHVDDPFAATVGMLLFSIAPYQMFELLQGRPTQAILLFPVLFIRHMIRVGERRSWTDPIIAGLSLAISGYQYWYYALFGGLTCLAWGIGVALRPRAGSGGSVRVLFRYAMVALVALVTVSPVAVPLITSAASGETPGLLDTDLWGFWSSPPVTEEGMTIGLFLWQPLRRLAGFYVLDPTGLERFLSQNVLVPAIALVALLLAMRDRDGLPRMALCCAMVMLVLLGAGPMVIVGDMIIPNLPYIAMVDLVDVMRRLWWPARASAFVVILAAVAVARLVLRAGRVHPLLAPVAALVVAVPWFADLAASRTYPMRTWSAEVPAGYRCLAHGPEGAIIELPYNWNQLHLYYQTAHQRPLLGGMLEDNLVFTPAELQELLDGNRYVSSLFEMAKLDPAELEEHREDLEALQDLGYRYVVLQRDAFVPTEHERDPSLGPRDMHEGLRDNAKRSRHRRSLRALTQLLGQPVYSDARINIYAPFGDPSPCADVEIAPNRVAVGTQEDIEVDVVASLKGPGNVLRRLWIGPVNEWGKRWEDLPAAEEPPAKEPPAKAPPEAP